MLYHFDRLVIHVHVIALLTRPLLYLQIGDHLPPLLVLGLCLGWWWELDVVTGSLNRKVGGRNRGRGVKKREQEVKDRGLGIGDRGGVGESCEFSRDFSRRSSTNVDTALTYYCSSRGG